MTNDTERDEIHALYRAAVAADAAYSAACKAAGYSNRWVVPMPGCGEAFRAKVAADAAYNRAVIAARSAVGGL